MSEPRDPESTGNDPESTGKADSAAASRRSGTPTGKPARGRRRSAPTEADDPSTEAIAVATATRAAGRGRQVATTEGNVFRRLIQFFRQVIAELRKVIWPNRRQMVTYTIVVLVFVSFMTAYIGGLDVVFLEAVRWIFG
ncbi:preprotein translocase subunit SecE [Millisia brevis]|uniref:preprotein translocase subunit SecE n=1 Tax=Millisia brevis TaxID=264148 RepID=UPI000A0047D2|nr:preprotein translocase subunit SecE [Millisia brevis]